MKNKLVLSIICAILLSMILVWYLAHRSPSLSRALTPNTLIVGTNAEYAPFSFMDKGQISGFDIDLISLVA
jgi:ABC-type amino acid transport substrate-binding protein